MRDNPTSIDRIKLLHPAVRQEVQSLIEKIESSWSSMMAIRITQGLRTIEEQNALYAQGRTTHGKIVTNAKGGTSYHNYGLAVDFALLHDKNADGKFEELSWDMYTDWNENHINDWQEVVNVFVQAGWEWGGNWNFKDYPHFQKTFGLTYKQLLSKYNAGLFLEGTNYVLLPTSTSQ